MATPDLVWIPATELRVKIEGALPPQYFDQAIAYELQHATAK